MSKHDASTEISETRRRGIRRTAWAIGLVAVGVYVAFMLSAVLP
jgi:hypothetical protein